MTEEYHRYPWEGPENDVIVESDDELDEGPGGTMKASEDRTNYIQVRGHRLHTDEPEDLSHSFKKGGRGEAPSAFDYLLAAVMGCQVNSLEQMLHKARIKTYDVDAECTGFTVTEGNVKRVQRIDLDVTLAVPEENEAQARRCLDVYEKGCVIGETIKRAVDVRVAKSLVCDDPSVEERRE